MARSGVHTVPPKVATKVKTEMEEQSGNTGVAHVTLGRSSPVGRVLAMGTGSYPLPRGPQSLLCLLRGTIKGAAWEEVGQAHGRRAGFMRGAWKCLACLV